MARNIRIRRNYASRVYGDDAAAEVVPSSESQAFPESATATMTTQATAPATQSTITSYTRQAYVPIPEMYAAQRDITKSAWEDPIVREYLLVAVIGGVISSAALARANQRLTADESDDSFRSVLTAGILALATGAGSIMWKLNMAARRR
jgi:hypothetical protein